MSKNTQNLLKETLDDRELLDKLNAALENKNTVLKISINDKENIKIEEMKDEEISIKQEKNDNRVNNSKMKKITKSFFKVFEELFDSVAKNFLKKKYKINNSVYNDGKKAVVAVRNKDAKTFWKKATDSILYIFKKIPAETKKVIKNTKNVAIDEIFSWKKE